MTTAGPTTLVIVTLSRLYRNIQSSLLFPGEAALTWNINSANAVTNRGRVPREFRGSPFFLFFFPSFFPLSLSLSLSLFFFSFPFFLLRPFVFISQARQRAAWR